MSQRVAILLYGTICYLAFLGAFLYAIAFVGGFWVPRTVDAPVQAPVGAAVVVNLALLSVFAIQHSVMARPAFKRWITRWIPAAAERSTFVLLASLALFLLYWQWRPIDSTIWNFSSSIARSLFYGMFALGWVIVLASTFLINHFDLFGLRQTWLAFQGKPYAPLKFATPGLYKFVRHPLYLGFLLAFWSAPTMTASHLLFALTTTAYILIAIQLEEHDLVAFHGAAYDDYRRRVPMLVPALSPRDVAAPTPVADADSPS